MASQDRKLWSKPREHYLSFSVEEICLSLRTKRLCTSKKELLNESMKQSILAKKTRGEQACELLRVLGRRGSCEVHSLLYEAFKEHEVYLACDDMEPDRAPHEPMTQEEPSCPQELEADWFERQLRDSENRNPCQDPRPSIQSIRDLKCEQVENDILFWRHIGNNNYYQMTSPKRVRVTVLREIPEQYLDWKILDRFCKEFNFAKLVCEDVKKPADLENLDLGREYDCTMMFIKARGQDGIFNGNEGSGLKRVVDKLRSEQQLTNKPKIIFYMTLTSGNDEVQGLANISAACDDLYFVQVTEYGCEMLQADGRPFIRFIHLFVDMFFNNAKTLEFLKLLSCLNMKYEKPVAKCRSTGRRKLYFFPGCKNACDQSDV